MINVIIKDDDILYLKGMIHFLSEIFAAEQQENLHFMLELTASNIRNADVIVLPFCNGEDGTCLPELQLRRQGIVIGLVDKQPEITFELPLCYQDIVFISRRAPLHTVKNTIIRAWGRYQNSVKRHANISCLNCQHKMLSPQQVRIMAALYKGKAVAEIASELMNSDKTVFSHKYLMMQKFNLHSDYELLVFLSRLAAKNIIPNAFRDYLDLCY